MITRYICCSPPTAGGFRDLLSETQTCHSDYLWSFPASHSLRRNSTAALNRFLCRGSLTYKWCRAWDAPFPASDYQTSCQNRWQNNKRYGEETHEKGRNANMCSRSPRKDRARKDGSGEVRGDNRGRRYARRGYTGYPRESLTSGGGNRRVSWQVVELFMSNVCSFAGAEKVLHSGG